MKCPKCGGEGKVLYPGVADYYVKCSKCNGTGEVSLTNDEWRKACSAEEFAGWVANLFVSKYEDPEVYQDEYDTWLWWLGIKFMGGTP